MAEKPTYKELEKRIQELEQAESEHERFEEELQESQTRFQLLFERTPLGYQSLDEDGNFIDVNPAWLDIFGYSRKEIIGKSFSEFLHPDWRNHFKESFAHFKAIGQILGVEFEMIKKDDSFIIVSFNGKIGKDKYGGFQQAHCILEDVKERRRIKEMLKREMDRSQQYLDIAGVMIVVIDTEQKVSMINMKGCEILGYEKHEIIGKNWFDHFIKTEDIEEVKEVFNQIISGNIEPVKYNENEILTKSGGVKILTWHNSLVRDESGNIIGTLSSGDDITERKYAEEELKESEEKHKELFERSLDCVYTHDFEGNFIDANQTALDLFGYTKEEISSLNFASMLSEDALLNAFNALRDIIKKGFQDGIIEYKVKNRNGDYLYIESTGSLLYKDGKPHAIMGTARDITERKRAEKALKESEEKYRNLVENIPDIIYSIDKSFKITATNLPAANFYGYEANELLGKDFSAFVHPDDKTHVVNSFLEAIENRQEWARGTQFRMVSKHGVTHWVEINSHMQFDEDGSYLREEGVIRDISERKEAEKELNESREKLVRLKKMDSLGLLAGGVAHDLNNVLSGIVSYPELILMDLPEDSKFRKPIEAIQESGNRAVAIVQDLLTVARGVATVRKPLNLNTIIKEYLLSSEFKELEQFYSVVRVKANLDADLFNVKGSQVHIKKAITDLISNASEAVERGGNVIISTMNRYIDRPIRGYNDINIGEYVVLSVSDDGPGISPIDLERIFEPFYTKKVMGRSGTGLGLSVVWNTVQDHNGYIDVASDEDGTIFQLYFPITRDELSDGDLPRLIKYYKGDGETILIIDDVESQRKITYTMLDRLGYKNKAVSSGEEAVEYLKEHTVDLILLDMIMDPGINGRETYERIIKIHPNQKAIIVSGFAETDEVKETIKLGASQYIKKPFTLEKIGLAVKEELLK